MTSALRLPMIRSNCFCCCVFTVSAARSHARALMLSIENSLRLGYSSYGTRRGNSPGLNDVLYSAFYSTNQHTKVGSHLNKDAYSDFTDPMFMFSR